MFWRSYCWGYPEPTVHGYTTRRVERSYVCDSWAHDPKEEH
jgi:hypothetical protein